MGEAVRVFDAHPTVLAVGVNCTPPRFMTSLISRLCRALPDTAIIAYPNSAETFEVSDNSWSGEANCDMTAVSDWIAAGATLVGGCCRVGPAQIRAMAELLKEQDI